MVAAAAPSATMPRVTEARNRFETFISIVSFRTLDSAGASRSGGFRDFDKAATFYVVYVAVDGDAGRHQRMIANAFHIVDACLLLIGNREPLDELACTRARPSPYIAESRARQFCRF